MSVDRILEQVARLETARDACLFALGFDALCGTVVEDDEAVVRAVSQGAVTGQIRGVRRVCLFREERA